DYTLQLTAVAPQLKEPVRLVQPVHWEPAPVPPAASELATGSRPATRPAASVKPPAPPPPAAPSPPHTAPASRPGNPLVPLSPAG
ncbi:MAG: hypothetical protein NT031_18830, partial [Planctomycetota bacterium]|nr:hypothetical protein [Planctomycetota bacterium]